MIRLTIPVIFVVIAATATPRSDAAAMPSASTPAIAGGSDDAPLFAAADAVTSDATLSIATSEFPWSAVPAPESPRRATPPIDATVAVSPSDTVTPPLPGDAVEREPTLAYAAQPAMPPAASMSPRSPGSSIAAAAATGTRWPAAMLVAALAFAVGAAAFVIVRTGGIAPAIERARASIGGRPDVRTRRRRSSPGSRA